MKKFLVPTDFSVNATHAASYAYQLAQQLNADLVLCNAVVVPAETPQAGLVVWPMEETDLLLSDSKEELERLKLHMVQNDHSENFRPAITLIAEPGLVSDVVDRNIDKQHIDLVIMGTHGSGSLSAFLLGDHASQLIDNVTGSLLLIPPAATFIPIKKIAFAIDLEYTDKDLEQLYKLIPLAKALNAEILIVHIQHDKQPPADLQQKMDQFLTDVSNKADYPNIYYRIVTSDDTEKGLKWLSEHGQVDMLALLHHQHGFFDSLFNGSHTHRMASQVNIPFLVISA